MDSVVPNTAEYRYNGGRVQPQNGNAAPKDPAQRVVIFDTTLRDGEQSPGCTMTADEKMAVARQLAVLGVDVIEAGFPAASDGDFDAVQRIAREVRGPVIAGLARANEGDIDRCWDAVKEAERPRIHVFLSTSDIHLEHQFRLTRAQAKERAREMVARAKGYCADVEFSAMDATRSDWQYLAEVVAVAIAAGATTINVPDTVGFSTPDEYSRMIMFLKANVPGIDDIVLSVHCHNDLGLAVANSLAAVKVGARQVECTINGIGERAGNAALEEIVMALRVRADMIGGAWCEVDTTQIIKASRMVSSFTGMLVQANKAIVGGNAFSHESGIHQDGMLKHRATYEIMDAALVGAGDTTLVLGKHSGRHAFRKRLEALGYTLDAEELNRAFFQFKQLCDKKKVVSDQDIEALIQNEVLEAEETPEAYRLENLQVTCSDTSPATAMVKLVTADGRIVTEAAAGDGPVDAIVAAVNRVTGMTCELTEFTVGAVTKGADAMGETVVQVVYNGSRVTGRGVSTDIIMGSAKAYINGVNKLVGQQAKQAQAATPQGAGSTLQGDSGDHTAWTAAAINRAFM